MDENKLKLNLKKSEQVIRLFEELWEKRIYLLSEYYKKKKGFKFLLFNKSKSTQSELAESFIMLKRELLIINSREQKIIDIIRNNLADTITSLDTFKSELTNLQNSTPKEINPDNAKQYTTSIEIILPIAIKYQEMMRIQQNILDLEIALLNDPSEENWKLYLLRIEFFSFEFNKIISKYEVIKKQKISILEIHSSIEQIKSMSTKKLPVDYIAPSTVSAFFRVGSTNIASGIILGNPFTNPYFWKLSSIIFILVIAVNFIDYYFNVFTNITSKINKLMKLTK
ncbi:MAG: hypothetical protein ACP5NV_01000 [Candidatus Woesearchaeota archaeon]